METFSDLFFGTEPTITITDNPKQDDDQDPQLLLSEVLQDQRYLGQAVNERIAKLESDLVFESSKIEYQLDGALEQRSTQRAQIDALEKKAENHERALHTLSQVQEQPSREETIRSLRDTHRHSVDETENSEPEDLDSAATTSADEESYSIKRKHKPSRSGKIRRHQTTFPPVDSSSTGSQSSSVVMRGDLPALTSSATRAVATIALPRAIEDVLADINQEIKTSTTDYTTDIIGTKPSVAATPDTRFVRLASVDPITPTHSTRKLLDADLNKVTVYRRFTESSLTSTAKAKVILSAMGIPPNKSKGFELPTELVINGKSDPNDPVFDADGKNNNAIAIIKEIFKIYKEYVAKEEEELAMSSGLRLDVF